MPKRYNTIPVVAYNLMGEERRLFSSIVHAATTLGLNYETARKNIGRHPVNGWLLARLNEEELILDKIAEWKEAHRIQEKKAATVSVKTRRTPNKDGKVSLRIDKHTVILVDPEHATEAYAEQWREKHRTANLGWLKTTWK